MGLIDDVKSILDRLAPHGWNDLLRTVTNNILDIEQSDSASLAEALNRQVGKLDRSHPGFEDFHPAGDQAITAGQPSRSLLFHALASPNVYPRTSDGRPPSDPMAYPTLGELDTLENYIYSLMADRTDLEDTFVAVFAYQYRVASRTSHRRYADMAFSRTGVARVGTTGYTYDRSRRSFWVLPGDGSDNIAVLPARYGTFLARRAKPGAAGSVQGGHKGQRDEDFIFPVHKLFSGTECLAGHNLSIDYGEFHRNEKLRRIHDKSLFGDALQLPAGFRLSDLPFVRDSTNGGDLVRLEAVGSTVLVVPIDHDLLVRTVSQMNYNTRSDQIVHFQVLEESKQERMTTSTLYIQSVNDDRLAPEYVNIRHEVDPAGPPGQIPTDLGSKLDAVTYERTMRIGGYAAAHFTDDNCDGCVEAVVRGLNIMPENLPAYSLVTAPDFLPLADQIEVETDDTIRQVKPLSKGRLPVNPTLLRPNDLSKTAFPDRKDRTVTAVIGDVASASRPRVPIQGQPNRAVSFLPDSASNVFAPGWDVSRGRDGERDSLGTFLSSWGLGSPFPEDVKLCAALASFWPAVAPDNGRTFGNDSGPGINVDLGNQLPMLDEELGFHPHHERVVSGEVSSYRGWDGEYGPFFENVGGQLFVNYADIFRSDYVSHALAGRIRVSLTAEVQSEELIARNDALDQCQAIPGLGLSRPRRQIIQFPCLVVFRSVNNWPRFSGAHQELKGSGFLLEFAFLRAGSPEPTDDLFRVRKKVVRRVVCQVGDIGVAYKVDSSSFRFWP